MKRASMVKMAVATVGAALAVAGGASAATSAGADTSAPVVTISTPHGAVRYLDPATNIRDDATRIIVRSGAPVRPIWPESRISGRVNDDRAGVSLVDVVFQQCVSAWSTERAYSCSSALPITALHSGGEVTVTCSDSSQTACTWSVGVPSIPGHYLVKASAVDRAGRSGPYTMPVHVFVI